MEAVYDVSDEVCEDCNGLCKALQGISDVAISYKVTEDTMYDINIAIKDIIEYVKHLMRDGQQRKAKYDAFSLLDHDTGFWIKDFAQKVLPVKFREGQKDYFGKKGMSMHIDVFMVRKSGQLKKHVYDTVIYRCDQGTSAVISIADTVLNQFQKDEPDVKKLLTKSDNAGCYHANYSAESMYNLCKAKGILLQNYDFNEPQCGKDQCDRESAAAKTIIRSYADAGHDILTAKCNVGVLKVENVLLEGPKIPKISDYHSFQFYPKHMKLWRYYGIGEGIEVKYNNLKTPIWR